MSETVPQAARIVIIGGGVVGCSTAFHLAREGERDVVLLERSKLTCGTTWHSAAMVRQLRSTSSLTRLAQYSAQLYSTLEAETGLGTGWMGCGSLSIANNPDRLHHIRRQASLARAFGIEVEEIGADEIRRLWPIAHTSDLMGGILSPSDGRVSASDLCASLIRDARGKGVRVFEDTPVSGFSINNGRIAGVPILGDHDGGMYIRDEGGGLMVGCFEPNARPVDMQDLPKDFSFDLLGENWEQFEPVMGGAIHRIPDLESAQVRMLLNGPESFTQDNAFLLGEAPELGGFFMCCGMNSVGVASSGGAGRALAEWVLAGEATMDLTSVDVRRFARVRNSLDLVRARSAEVLSSHYQVAYPGREMNTGRNLRLTPLHHRLAAHGALFGERAGWERASWFSPQGTSVCNELTFDRPLWHDCVAREHRAAREGVALFDQSTFGKLLVQGADTVEFLQRVCAGDVDVPVGRIVYTPMLNQRGGFESDLVAQRIGDDSYMLITGAAQPVRDAHLLRRQLRAREFVTVTDMSSAFAVLGVMGPASRRLLARLSKAAFDNVAFPYMSHAEIDIAGTVARAARISYAGELGWELHVPCEAAVPLYDALWEAGQDLGLINAGTAALAGLRLEKGYCSFGHDIGPDDTPLEAGLSFACKLHGSLPFIGREALERQREAGVSRRRVVLAAVDPQVQLLGNEPIIVDGEIVGHTSSAAYGHSVGRAVAMGYIRLEGRGFSSLLRDGDFEVEVALERVPVSASRRALVDPGGERLRADA
jgi:glycine cleavage system aminomethyltransferase T/glycine/D-amino acid oxidase-like deaminating enzyme